MSRAYYSSSIDVFCSSNTNEIIGALAQSNQFPLTQPQRSAWVQQIETLHKKLISFNGQIFFEFSIPRLGSRVDVVLLIDHTIFLLEFKVGADSFHQAALDQVWDYALDLKYFHEPSHNQLIAPILVATGVDSSPSAIVVTPQNDKVLFPIACGENGLVRLINAILDFGDGEEIDFDEWENGNYSPSPTIIEAATALYASHTVEDITRNDALGLNLKKTTETVSNIIDESKQRSKKSICFVTGVPGAGKTLIGLDIATKYMDASNQEFSVFLSGNGPLVDILREALSRNKVERALQNGIKIRIGDARRQVKAFIQNVHHFRDAYLEDDSAPPDHVAIFDEAQRAWNSKQTSNFMNRRKGIPDFEMSEPEFLISCLDRHQDWAVVVCLVGGGQEINTGEAGISEWIEAISNRFPDWEILISPNLRDDEYNTIEMISKHGQTLKLIENEGLHLSTSARSFRSEKVSQLVKQTLDIDIRNAKKTLAEIGANYPIVITRDLGRAKRWLRDQARGSERYGIVVSSQAERLRPLAIHVKAPIKPVHWFLHDKDDVRSSYYLEDVATEFHIQGLELDWVCVTWDADFRFKEGRWDNWSFRGSKWQRILQDVRKTYLKNAYRVLLTRARQGMVIVIPAGDKDDHTRMPEFYDATYDYLRKIGFQELS